MTKAKLEKKTPKQLMTALRNMGWSKRAICELLEDADVDMACYLSEMTFLELCKCYGETIIDCVLKVLETYERVFA